MAMDMRPARPAKNITLQAAANGTGLHIKTISRIERGKSITPEIVTTYRRWLTTA